MSEAPSISSLRRLMLLWQARDETKQAATTAEKEYRDAEADMFEKLEASAIVGNYKVDLGEPWGVVSFGARETHYAKVFDDAAAQEHFKQRAMINEVSAPKFVMKRVNEIVRDAIEQGRTDKLPPGVSYTTKRSVAITRQKS